MGSGEWGGRGRIGGEGEGEDVFLGWSKRGNMSVRWNTYWHQQAATETELPLSEPFSYRLVSSKRISPPIHVLTTSSAPRLLSVEGVATIEVWRKQQSGQKRIWVVCSSRGCGSCLLG